MRFIERNRDVSYQSDVYTDAHPTSLLQPAGRRRGRRAPSRAACGDGFDAARDRGGNLAFMGAATRTGGCASGRARDRPALKSTRTTLIRTRRRDSHVPRGPDAVALHECELIGIQRRASAWRGGRTTPSSTPPIRGCTARIHDRRLVKSIVSVRADTIGQPVRRVVVRSRADRLLPSRARRRQTITPTRRATSRRRITVFANGSHRCVGARRLQSRPQEPTRRRRCSAYLARSARCSRRELAAARAASPAARRHATASCPSVPGGFIRLAPGPSTSCSGAIASAAHDDHVRSISDHAGSARRGQCSALRGVNDSTSRASCRCRCVPV